MDTDTGAEGTCLGWKWLGQESVGEKRDIYKLLDNKIIIKGKKERYDQMEKKYVKNIMLILWHSI